MKRLQIETVTLHDGSRMDVIRDIPAVRQMADKLQAYQDGKAIVNQPVFCVCVDTGGAHEADCVYSIWTDPVAAETEAKRLNESGLPLGCYSGTARVVPINLNEQRNDWIK